MRAAAIEARLSGLAPPPVTQLVSVKDEPADSPVPSSMGDDDLEVPIKFEPDGVDDPHTSAEERRREMEEEMDIDERRGLRGGWEEFFQSAGGKRPSHTVDGGSGKAARTGANPTFGAATVRQETLRAYGMASTTLRGTSRKLGGTGREQKPKEVPVVVDEKPALREWACSLCTYRNIANNRRCGTSAGNIRSLRYLLRADKQRYAVAAGTAPCRTTYTERSPHEDIDDTDDHVNEDDLFTCIL